MMHFIFKATPTIKTNYSCYIEVVEIVLPTIWGPHHHITLLVIMSNFQPVSVY